MSRLLKEFLARNRARNRAADGPETPADKTAPFPPKERQPEAPAAAPDPGPAASAPSRFAVECWLAANRPDLLHQLHRTELAVEDAWLAGDPEELAGAEARLEAILQEARQGMEAAGGVRAGETPVQGVPGQEEQAGQVGQAQEEAPAEQEGDPFERACRMFEARRVWTLTPGQAARMERLFLEKGPVLVRYRIGKIERWLGAEEFLMPEPKIPKQNKKALR